MNKPEKDTQAKAINQLFELVQTIMVRLDRLEQRQEERNRPVEPITPPKRAGLFK